ncbi:hypothetical protein K505DRAFT_376286 [Melanomma pulvis-pyrius CBS 109.77]|uniref:Cora-domain-containing protein n=1 Tax=Melanomma pulvis-pyrius CBS 109.77 TaxID=1314802 RepID=A0A6A6X899_9PLEO|nr:hypothetical protein K505DRAFT_376286 [Melanomma pulvis-pyrius CBS 109.77]
MSTFRELHTSSSRAHDELGKSYELPPSYTDYVKALCLRNPCLLNLFGFLSYPRGRQNACHVAALDFRENIDHPITRLIADIDYLPDELHDTPAPAKCKEDKLYHDHPLQGRILIIEDLTKDVVELLGSTLEIDPLFFAMHLHTIHRTGMRQQTPDEAILPSRLLDQNYMNFSYHRPITCDALAPFGGRLMRDTAIDRKLVFLRSTTIGLAQHCASVIKFELNNGFWIALILADPPIGDTYFVDGQKDKEPHKIHLDSKPFLGAYEDFMKPPKFSSDWTHLDDRSRGGMFHDVVQYWERSIPACFDAQNPTIESLAYYPLRIVAAEWVKYVAVMQYCIKQYEYQGDRLPDLDKFNMDLRELQGWRRRSMNSQQKINSIIRQLKAREKNSPPSGGLSLRYLIEDFELISSNIENAGRRLENMLPVVMSLVQVIDARQSLAETANISRLTVLALIFVPLSFVSSLFSMNSENMPGSPHFWVYFAVAVPVTLLVVLVARPPAWIERKLRAWTRGSKTRREQVSQPTFKEVYKEKGIA